MSRWLTVAATIGMISVNGLANGLPINGKTTGDISGDFDILFTPPGYVFSIWGLIYLSLCAVTVVQALPAHQNEPRIKAIRPWYLLNAAANSAWIFAWHYEQFVLSLGIMFVILGSLIAIYRQLLPTRDDGSAVGLLLRSAFSLYLGWISIATIANFTIVAWGMGYTAALSSAGVTLALLVLATAVCAAVSLRFANPVYAGVFVWATVGIGIKHAGLAGVGLLPFATFALAAVCALVMGASCVLAFRPRP